MSLEWTEFQLTNVSGNIPKTKDNKIHHFSITRLWRKRKVAIQEPIETVIVRAQQSFDVVGGLTPVQTELEDDRILSALKKYKNLLYRVTPLGILCSATIANDNKQICITAEN